MTRYEDGRHEVSNSEVQAFSDCRRRWWLSYYRRLRPAEEKPVGPLAIGSRVHRVLEEGYSSPGRGEAALALLAETIEEDYRRAEDLGPEVLKQFESEAELALIMIEGFIEWAAEEGLDSGWEVVSHEQVVKTPPISIAGELVVLKGKLDQIIRRLMDGSLFMRDWKTTPTMTPVMMQFGPQLKTYLTILALTEPDARVSGGQFVFLKKVKRTAKANPPFYGTEDVYVSSEELGTFWRQLTATLERMVEAEKQLDAGADHHRVVPPRPTRDCEWRCPFYLACPMFDDGSRVEELIAARYRAGDPYEYYGLDDKDKETT